MVMRSLAVVDSSIATANDYGTIESEAGEAIEGVHTIKENDARIHGYTESRDAG
jgi:hypothetical protein